MRIGIVTNVLDPSSESEGGTTFRLAETASRRGHDVWFLSPGQFNLSPDDELTSRARVATPQSAQDHHRGKKGDETTIEVGSLDVLFLRSNPSIQKPWAQSAGIEFGRFAVAAGVLVLNDPDGLARASSKLYLQRFPPQVRPRTLVTRHVSLIEKFAKELGRIVIKPIRGFGGQSVFMATPGDNLVGMIHAVSRDGYVVAQEYLPLAAEGDTRLFLLNGVPLMREGKTAAFRRIRTGEDLRSNVSVGGRIRRATIDAATKELVEEVSPQLIEDGMFLVGLDIVGDKLLEINVFSPGGLGNAQRLEGVDFSEEVVDALERKVGFAQKQGRRFENRRLATQ